MRMKSSVLTAFAGVLACGGTVKADNGFLLGLDYSKPVGYGLTAPNYSILAAATDASGAVYLLTASNPSAELPVTAVLGPMPTANTGGPNYYVEKLTPQGDQVYLTVLGFAASALAVDASGNAYVTGPTYFGQPPTPVAKLNAAGTAFLYNVNLGQGVNPTAIAVDPSGKAYVTGFADSSLKTTPNAFRPASPGGGPFVVQLNGDGSVGYATFVGDNLVTVTAIAVDATGAAGLVGTTDGSGFSATPGAYLSKGGRGFLMKLKPDGSGPAYATFTGDNGGPTGLALDADGNAVVSVLSSGQAAIKAFNSDGTALRWMSSLPAGFSFPTSAFNALTDHQASNNSMAMDEAGNTYVVGGASVANIPVTNTLASCGSGFLAAYGPSGGLLQSTFLPTEGSSSGLAVAPNGAVYVVGSPFEPQAPNGGPLLVRMSQQVSATPVQLACVGNAGSYNLGPVAPGELVSLFGHGLGPAQGVQPQVNRKTSFPEQLANVQVTFDGKPAPLIYVQDHQINAIAPWSLTVGATTEICVVNNSAKTNCIERYVVSAAPGVFTTDGVRAAAVNQDGSINSSSNPAAPGSIVSVFATGLGPISPPQGDGSIVGVPLPVNTFQWSLVIQTLETLQGPILFLQDPQYQGPAPFEVAGVSQINFTVGTGASPGLYLMLSDPNTGNFAVSPAFYLWIAGQ